MATLHLVCGVICSGKTTYTDALLKQSGGVPLGLDELTLSLLPEYMGEELAAAVFDGGKRYLLHKAEQILAAGCDVVLDWGFWRRAERDAVRSRFSAQGHRVLLHYLEVSPAFRAELLAARAANTAGSYHADEELLRRRDPEFQPPADAECDLHFRDGVRVK